jgi:integrase
MTFRPDDRTPRDQRAASTEPDGYVFATTCGSKPKQGNIRRRALDKAVARANEKLIDAGDVPLPKGLTPHKLRHTFASILVTVGVDPGSVVDQLGHADPGFTLRVYRHGMRRDNTARERLLALVGGADWAPTGTGAPNRALPDIFAPHSQTPNPA